MDSDSCVVVDGGVKPQEIARRDGKTYDHERDGERLHYQHNRVLSFMRTHGWVTLSAISEATGDPEASISARLRDLRKPRFGSHLIERRYVRRGLYEYRLGGQLELT